MKWTISLILFSFSCFVVWKILLNNTHKDCVVIDIRAFNKISMPDAYSVFLQADILAAVQNVKYIFIVNCSVYFYQWCVNSEHWHHLIVISHHSQKIFKIAVMSYCNTFTYVQHMMNWILWSHHNYSWIYMNDIIIFSAILTEHLYYLQRMFNELTFKEICLSSKKFFLKYSSIQLLN